MSDLVRNTHTQQRQVLSSRGFIDNPDRRFKYYIKLLNLSYCLFNINIAEVKTPSFEAVIKDFNMASITAYLTLTVFGVLLNLALAKNAKLKLCIFT